jgi:ATP-dependent protease ClpP protease subunit
MIYNIIIDKTIGQGSWYDDGYSKKNLRDDLSHYRDKHVDILITSGGGSVDDAIDMYQQLRDHGDVTVYIDGFCASAATIIAMGAKEIRMNKYSYMLIHKCSSPVQKWENLNADELQSLIDELIKQKCNQDKIDNGIAAIYADRCKKKCEDIKKLLDAANWLTANECIENGLVDSLMDGDPVVVDNSLYKFVASAGYPQLPIAFKNDVQSSFINRVISAISSAFSTKKTEDDDVKHSSNLKKYMHKKFLNVCKILNIDGVDIDDDKKTATITDDQLTAIESKITDMHNQAAADKKTIDELKEQIKTLEDTTPADSQERVEDNDDKSDKITAVSMYNNVKNFI